MKKRLIIIFVFLFAMSIAYSKPPWAGGPKKNNWKQDKVTEIEVDEVEIDDCTDCSSCENNCYGEDEKAVKKSWKKKKKEKKKRRKRSKAGRKNGVNILEKEELHGLKTILANTRDGPKMEKQLTL